MNHEATEPLINGMVPPPFIITDECIKIMQNNYKEEFFNISELVNFVGKYANVYGLNNYRITGINISLPNPENPLSGITNVEFLYETVNK